MRERDREMDCYGWYHVRHIFKSQSGTAWVYLISSKLMLRYIFQNLSSLCFSTWGSPLWVPPKIMHLVYMLAGLWITDSMTLLSLYNILNVHTFSFCFLFHMVHFYCPLFAQVQYPVLKSLTNQSVKVNM